MVTALVAGREGPDIERVAYAPLRDPDAIAYRHEVFRDLESADLLEVIRAFAARMAVVRGHVGTAARIRHRHERNRWRLAALDTYVAAVEDLETGLRVRQPRSRALVAFGAHLATCVASAPFQQMRSDVRETLAGLDDVAYRLRIGEHRIVIGPPREEPDFGAEIRATFARFGADPAATLHADVFDTLDMNPVEAAVLDRVVRLNPPTFRALDDCIRGHESFVEPGIEAFVRDIELYLAYLDLVAPIRSAGLPLCYPEVSTDDRQVHVAGLYDLALARRLVGQGMPVVANDVDLAAGERVLVVTGPSQGGKTTFARAVGQLFHLAGVGCPVPAASAQLPIVDAIQTHFDRPEVLEDPGGRLEADLRRLAATLAATTGNSLVILNETFSSTTAADALELNRAVLGEVRRRGATAVVVTFLDELAAEDGATVSMVGLVDPDDPERRTFRFERRPADGLAYAKAVADRHRLGYAAVRERVER